MIKVSVVGAKGRMGSHVVDAVNNAADTELALALDAGDDLTDPLALLANAALSADNPDNPTMTAGFTFLGQFIDHDMTFDPTSSLARRQDPEAIRNFRIPALDLDNVYGGGPGVSPALLQ